MGLLGGSESKMSKSLLENEAVQAPTPPQNDEFSIKWHLKPPNNPTSHYGACHAGYSLALRYFFKKYMIFVRTRD